MNNHLQSWCEGYNKISDEQNGLRPGRNTVDQLFSVSTIVETRKIRRLSTFVSFIDFRKAYDRIPRGRLLQKLQAIGIKGAMFRVFEAIIVPGWSDYVSDAHHPARNAFLIWQGAGKPRQGPIFEIMKRSRSIFKCSLRYCRRNQAQIRAESLARKMASNNYLSFWKDVKLQQQTKTSIINSIDKIEGTEQILHMWKDHY